MLDAYITCMYTSFIDIHDRIVEAIHFSGCKIRYEGCQNAVLWERDEKILILMNEVLDGIKSNVLAEGVVFWEGNQ